MGLIVTTPSNKVVSLIATQTTMSLSQSKSLPNHLWNAARVKNFMRAMELKPTKWDDNIAALAKAGSMTVDEFMKTNPVTYGEKVYYSTLKCSDILGDQIYSDMVRFRQLDSAAPSNKIIPKKTTTFVAGWAGDKVVAAEAVAAVEAVVEKEKKKAAELEAWKRQSIRVIWKTGDPPLAYSLDDWFAGKVAVLR